MGAQQNDKDESTGLIVGRNPVREALAREGRRIEKVMVQQGAQVGELRAAAKEAGVPLQVVPVTRLRKLAAGANHQGVIAIASPIAYWALEDMLGAIATSPDEVREKAPLLLALDGIEDPYNFGAILRSAVAAGVAGVLVPERGMAPLSTTAVKASAGTARTIPIARVTNLANAVYGMKERGYWIAGLEGAAEGAVEVWDWDWLRATVLVVGSEGSGMRPRVQAQCDGLLSIPMPGAVESLNASVAAGVALFAAVQKKSKKVTPQP